MKHGYSPSDTEIAHGINMPPARVRRIIERQLTTTSLDQGIGEDADSDPLLAFVADEHTLPADLIAQARKTSDVLLQQVKAVLACVPDDQKEFFKVRYGLDGSRTQKKLDYMEQRFGASHTNVQSSLSILWTSIEQQTTITRDQFESKDVDKNILIRLETIEQVLASMG